MKSVLRFGSIAGGCHTAPPLYWLVCPPLSGMSKVFQSIAPVLASSATTLPRKLQHGYAGFVARVSSVEDNRRSSNDCCGMSLHLSNPPAGSCLPIHCDYVRAVVHLLGTKNVPNN